MNIHPAFVHFPIALLFVYSAIELLPVARYVPAFAWDSIKRFSLYVGTFFGYLAIISGVVAEEAVGELPTIEPHETAAYITVGIFTACALILYFGKEGSVWRTYGTKVLAACGLIMLFVVGALGANIVYGPDVDPIVKFVVSILGVR